jgi:hypothetical protein
VNPDLDMMIHAQDKVFYIADERIPNLDWHRFKETPDV